MLNRKTLVLLSLCLPILISGCASVQPAPCPARPPYTGTTWSDLAAYESDLETLYDSCARK